jgi:hypothetical protein
MSELSDEDTLAFDFESDANEDVMSTALRKNERANYDIPARDMSCTQLMMDSIAQLHVSATARDGALQSLNRKVHGDPCLSFLQRNCRIRANVAKFGDECGDISALAALLHKQDLTGLSLVKKLESDIKKSVDAPYEEGEDEEVSVDTRHEYAHLQHELNGDEAAHHANQTDEEVLIMRRMVEVCMLELGVNEAEANDKILDLVQWASVSLPPSAF